MLLDPSLRHCYGSLCIDSVERWSFRLLNPEELALTLNGKKRKINKADFDAAMMKVHIPKKAIENLWDRII